MKDVKDQNGILEKDEKRLTKYGVFLRKTSLDEIPELYNILVGKMSFVGPRPLLVKYLDRYSEVQKHRHDVRPGLTGYAQCNGRNGLSWKKKFELDVWYTKHVSLLLDLKIIFKTIYVVIKKQGINGSNSIIMEEFEGE